MVFEISGRLPGLNEIIDAAKSHFGEYASMKETYTNMVGWLAKKLPNDSQKHITGIMHRFGVDKKNPRIEVEIADVEKDMKVLEGQELWD